MAYAGIWLSLGLFGPAILSLILAMPPALVSGLVGLALIGPFIGAATSAFADPGQRFAAATTLVVTASGVTAFGIGAAFWGLAAGLALQAAGRFART
jgi:benzoate membrane transport protein